MWRCARVQSRDGFGGNVGLFYGHVSTEQSDWSQLHSFHAENSYKTMLARVCGVSLPDSESVMLLVFPHTKHLDV